MSVVCLSQWYYKQHLCAALLKNPSALTINKYAISNCRMLMHLSMLTQCSPSFFDVSSVQGEGGGGFRPLHNFLSFNPNLTKPSAIDYWGMIYLLVVVYYT